MASKPWLREHGALVVTLILLSATLLPVFANQFVYDDVFVLGFGTVIHDLSNIPEFFMRHAIFVTNRLDPMVIDTYRPIPLVSFALDAAWTGKNPFGYHLTNLLLHLACCGLLYVFARRVMSENTKRFAWIAVACFAFSPWIGEAHVWISGRFDVLCAIFVLSTILVWDRYLSHQNSRSFLVIAFLSLCALWSKEVALGAFASLWFWPRLDQNHRPIPKRIHSLAPVLSGIALYLMMRLAVLGGMKSHGSSAQLSEAISNLGLVLLDGFRYALLPSPPYLRSMVESYVGLPFWVKICTLLLSAAIVFAAIMLRKRQALLSWSILFFIAVLAPVAIITTVIWPGFGRYLYLPIAGLSVGLVEFLSSALQKRDPLEHKRIHLFAKFSLGAYLIVSAFFLHLSVYDYRDDGTLYSAAIAAQPSHGFGYAFLGSSLINHGHPKEALPFLEQALERQPFEPHYRFVYGKGLIKTGQNDKAIALAQKWLNKGRASDAPRYFKLIADASMDTNPEQTTAALLACLHANPHWGSCKALLKILTNEHELKERYKESLRSQLEHPRNHALTSLLLGL